ncbi:hypothetical protein NC651_030756 [Populus alba x Populus x berolinensis]|nr:hypothetical protein NC651_030756 [Populus alba x Populus x berolinensis]
METYSIYVLGSPISDYGIRNSILKLDTTDDCFTKLSLPESLIRKDDRLFASISVFEKCRSAVCLDSSPHSTSGSYMDDERTGDTLGKAVQVYLSCIIGTKTAIMYKGGLLFVLGINGRVAPYNDEDNNKWMILYLVYMEYLMEYFEEI